MGLSMYFTPLSPYMYYMCIIGKACNFSDIAAAFPHTDVLQK